MNRRALLLFVVFLAGAFASAIPSEERSPKWPTVRASYLADHNSCEACGRLGTKKKPLEVHHIQPFHDHPELELERKNLQTLCDGCHFWLGHLGSYKGWNADARKDAAWYLNKVKYRESGGNPPK